MHQHSGGMKQEHRLLQTRRCGNEQIVSFVTPLELPTMQKLTPNIATPFTNQHHAHPPCLLALLQLSLILT
jgi:hypothetical protein